MSVRKALEEKIIAVERAESLSELRTRVGAVLRSMSYHIANSEGALNRQIEQHRAGVTQQLAQESSETGAYMAAITGVPVYKSKVLQEASEYARQQAESSQNMRSQIALTHTQRDQARLHARDQARLHARGQAHQKRAAQDSMLIRNGPPRTLRPGVGSGDFGSA